MSGVNRFHVFRTRTKEERMFSELVIRVAVAASSNLVFIFTSSVAMAVMPRLKCSNDVYDGSAEVLNNRDPKNYSELLASKIQNIPSPYTDYLMY